MISVSKKFIFVHIQKTAGNSISTAVSHYSQDKITFNNKQKRYNKAMGEIHRFNVAGAHISTNKHDKISDIYQKWDVDTLGAWKDYFKFTCIRNTWDRLIAFYFSPHIGRTEFNRDEFHDFIKEKAHFNQKAFLCIEEKIVMDFLMRFENLSHDFEKVCKHLGLEASLPHINQSNHNKPYQYYYAPDTIDLVQNLYGQEIELFEFMFE